MIILFYYHFWLLHALGYIPCNTIIGVAGGGASGAAAPDSWNQGDELSIITENMRLLAEKKLNYWDYLRKIQLVIS